MILMDGMVDHTMMLCNSVMILAGRDYVLTQHIVHRDLVCNLWEDTRLFSILKMSNGRLFMGSPTIGYKLVESMATLPQHAYPTNNWREAILNGAYPMIMPLPNGIFNVAHFDDI
mmetsp:Transcript_4836/g.6313  ORF Transcript_4836/g.6313 Transcript_4836/m.6313 type:complete len:115 (+) Transcript_4836:165-509(+)